MSTEVIPNVSIQEIYSGGQFTGVPSDGTPTDDAIQRGRIQKWLAGTVGGEFAAPDRVGMRVEQVFWEMQCAVAPDVTIYLVDDDNTEYLIHSASGSLSGSYVETNDGFLVPPSFKVRVKSNQAIDAVVNVVAEVVTSITGNGVSTDYEGSLANGRVDPGTVSIVAGLVTFTDPGLDGILVGAGGGGGSGTIDYLTGEIHLTFNTPADFGAGNPAATYDYNQIGRVGLVTRDGWGQHIASQVGMIGTENLPPTMQRS